MDQNLTWALALLGAVVLMAVVAHGAWASRKADPKRVSEWYKPEPPVNEPAAASADGAVSELTTAKTAVSADQPSLLDTAAADEADESQARTQPAPFSSAAEPALAQAAAVDIDLDPTTTAPGIFTSLDGPTVPAVARPDIAAKPTSKASPRSAKKVTPRLDPLIDVLTNFTLDKAMSGDALLAHLGTTQRIGSKPFLVEGLNTARGEWEALEPGQLYSELQAGVQLANRRGPINEIEYSEFVQKVQSFAEAINTSPVGFPDMLEVVARARELDTFASEHDAHLAVRLHTRSMAWSVGYVQQTAISLGFALGSMAGRWVWPAPTLDGAPPVLILSLNTQAALADDPHQAVVNEVTLGFDVPQSAEQTQPSPFTSWKTWAYALADKLDAQLRDDQDQPFGEEGFAAIEEALQFLYAQLVSRDLAAGSAAARRLFS